MCLRNDGFIRPIHSIMRRRVIPSSREQTCNNRAYGFIISIIFSPLDMFRAQGLQNLSPPRSLFIDAHQGRFPQLREPQSDLVVQGSNMRLTGFSDERGYPVRCTHVCSREDTWPPWRP